MTAPETPAPTPSTDTTAGGSTTGGKRSPAVVAAIVIVVVLVLAGGAFVVYKLTNKKDDPIPAYKVAKVAVVAAQKGDRTVVVSNSTSAGAAALGAFKAASLSGLTLRTCAPSPIDPNAKTCVFSRPGGQLTVGLARTGTTWKVATATLGPAGLPPTSTTTTSTP